MPSQQPKPVQPTAPTTNPCFASLYDFLIADPDDCPLAWHGITLYGRLDYGAGYEIARRPVQWQLSQRGSKRSLRRTAINRSIRIAPNGLGQSHVGVKGVEPIASDWSLVFKFQNGFDPFTLQRANGPEVAGSKQYDAA